ncbi:MAG: aminotransferase class I/II-fold pyridoxal phosphate-dependent enzyme [Bryobacterales bacterium]
MSLQKYIGEPSAVNIVQGLEAAVGDGLFGPGAKLPTVRNLAVELAVSPATVEAAYRRLRERGVVVGQGRRGTLVAPRPPRRPLFDPRPPAGLRDVATGNPDAALLPSLAAPIRAIDKSSRLYSHEINEPRLLELARRQFQSESIPADHLAVVSGAMDGLERVLRELLRPGDKVIVEDPGFPGIFDQLAALGLLIEPVAVDDRGPLPKDLERALRSGAKALIVTPRAQNPFGAAIDAVRAGELQRILHKAPDLLVLEDDHAGPVAGAPPVSLCKTHRGPWVHIRSTSKSLGPDLRLAVMSGDAATISSVQQRQLVGMRWVSHILQRIVVQLLERPSTSEQMRRARETYASRRQGLIDLLAARGILAHGRSGMNVWIPVREEARVVRDLAEAGWAVQAGERFRIKSQPAVRITIASLTEEHAIQLANDFQRIGVDQRTRAFA